MLRELLLGSGELRTVSYPTWVGKRSRGHLAADESTAGHSQRAAFRVGLWTGCQVLRKGRKVVMSKEVT